MAGADISAVTLRAVARRAGVSPGAPYHHFPDKGALLAAVAREGFEALGRVQASVEAPDPAARLTEMAAAYVRFAAAHRTHYRVMFAQSPSSVPGEAGQALQRAATATFLTLEQAIGAAQPALGGDERRKRTLLAWSLAHGAVDVAQWSADLDPHFDLEKLAQRVGQQVAALANADAP